MAALSPARGAAGHHNVYRVALNVSICASAPAAADRLSSLTGLPEDSRPPEGPDPRRPVSSAGLPASGGPSLAIPPRKTYCRNGQACEY
jgi:hypothetical protein